MDENAPLEHHGEPLRRLEPYDLTAEPGVYFTLEPGWQHKLMALAPRADEPAPFRAGPLTVSGEFSGEAYPGAIERLLEMAKNHPDYCDACEGFPCQGGHPPGQAEAAMKAMGTAMNQAAEIIAVMHPKVAEAVREMLRDGDHG